MSAVSADAYHARVNALLNHRFDALLIHVDAALTRLDDHYGAVTGIPCRFTTPG